jgi:hypothetical protein
MEKQLKDLKEDIKDYETKYSLTYEEFSKCVPDTFEGHEDWIKWAYLVNVSYKLVEKTEKLQLILGR